MSYIFLFLRENLSPILMDFALYKRFRVPCCSVFFLREFSLNKQRKNAVFLIFLRCIVFFCVLQFSFFPVKITLFSTWGILLPCPNAHFFPSLTFISSGHNKIFREKRSFFRRITGDCALILYRTIVILGSVGNFIFPREIFSSFPSPYGSTH